MSDGLRELAKRVLRRSRLLRRVTARLNHMYVVAETPPGEEQAVLYPAGHFYSPIPSSSEVRRRADRLFAPPPRQLAGIDLNEPAQLALLDRFKPFYDEQPFSAQPTTARRYFFENPAYRYSDAIFLHCMIRHARPRRIIEVGSGYSSCVMLDTNDLHFEGRIACTFVEPYPQQLRALLRPGDLEHIEILEHPLQNVGIDRFCALEANDILFIDSTHVVKTGSDLTYLFAEVLPALRPGVYVHLHDIFYPFEYPQEWVYEGRGWNEAYTLRAFLTFNGEFEIVLFNTFLEHFHRERFAREMALCLRDEGGSIWLRRRG